MQPGREAILWPSLVDCEAWKPQIKEMWKDAGNLCEWKHPRAPRVALLFDDERPTKAVRPFLRGTKIGQMVTLPPRGEGRAGGEDAEDWEEEFEEEAGEEVEVEGEEGGADPT